MKVSVGRLRSGMMVKLIKRKIIKFKAIRHYKRMINFAKMQIYDTSPSFDTMERYIGETIWSRYCSYCDEHDRKSILNCGGTCPLFSLVDNKEQDENYCCHGLWDRMSESSSWKSFIVNATNVLEYIKRNG